MANEARNPLFKTPSKSKSDRAPASDQLLYTTFPSGLLLQISPLAVFALQTPIYKEDYRSTSNCTHRLFYSFACSQHSEHFSLSLGKAIIYLMLKTLGKVSNLALSSITVSHSLTRPSYISSVKLYSPIRAVIFHKLYPGLWFIRLDFLLRDVNRTVNLQWRVVGY